MSLPCKIRAQLRHWTFFTLQLELKKAMRFAILQQAMFTGVPALRVGSYTTFIAHCLRLHRCKPCCCPFICISALSTA